MDNGKDKLFFRQKLMELVDDKKQMEAIFALYELTLSYAEEERKVRQREGIRRAKMEGKRLGRPKIQGSEDFEQIVKDWEEKRLLVTEAAAMSGMGISTFYRRVRELKDSALKRKVGDYHVGE